MSFDFSGLRLTIVDDSADTRDLFAFVFESKGATVVAVADVQQAIASCVTSRPDVVLCEPVLPDETGYDLPRRLAELPGGNQIIKIAVTRAAREGDRRQVLRAGFDAYLTKPVDLKQLEELVASLTSRRRETRLEQSEVVASEEE